MGDRGPRGRAGRGILGTQSAPVLASFADGGGSHIRPGLGRPLSPRLRSISISVFSPGALDLRHRRGAADTHPAAHTLPTSSEALPGASLGLAPHSRPQVLAACLSPPHLLLTPSALPRNSL